MSDWRLKLLIEEDEGAWPVSERFTVWIAPAVDGRVQRRLCIGAGETRMAAVLDGVVELRGAARLLVSEGHTEQPASVDALDPQGGTTPG